MEEAGKSNRPVKGVLGGLGMGLSRYLDDLNAQEQLIRRSHNIRDLNKQLFFPRSNTLSPTV